MMYLQRRGITYEDILKYNIGYCDQGLYTNRVIIPSYSEDGQLNFFVGRDIFESKMKYRNSPTPKDVVGFELFINWDEPIVLCEGPFDAIAIDGVAIGGSNINYQQAQIINQLDKEVIFVPDQDKAGIDVVRQAIYYNWPVSFPPWEKVKDCADAVNKYGRPFTLKSILDFVEINKTKIKVKSQLWK